MILRGRRNECDVLDSLVARLRDGRGGALLLRGEPGVGKTALLEYAIESAQGVRVARACGVESEMELAFAVLHQLCAPLLDRLDRLPGPQRDALCVAFGLSQGPAPDRFLVGLAALSLLSAAAAEQPLLYVVDDAQWLDQESAQVLGFVGRRLEGGPVAMVWATRELQKDCRGLAELVVAGLSNDAAHDLLASAIRVPLDEEVRERIVAETRGNPLALLELPRGRTPAELAGGFGVPDALPLSRQIEDSFRRRVMALPAETRRLLLVAAAEPVGEPVLVWRAAAQLGIGREAAAPAAEAELLEFGARVRFRHPLVRSAAYRAASGTERANAHGALAEATDPEVDPDRRAWHRAKATSGPDEDVAAELQRSARRALARGGLAAAAAFLEHAAELTPAPAVRAERFLAAARANHLAGAPARAAELLQTAEVGPLDELQRARVGLLRAQIAFASSRGNDAPPLLLEAAKQLEPLDPGLARETYLEAFSAAIFAGRLAQRGGMRDTAEAVRGAPPSSQPPSPSDLLLEGFSLLITDGYALGMPILKRALRAIHTEERSMGEELRRLWIAGHAACLLRDDAALQSLADREVRLARETGALSVLPAALSWRAALHLFAGELRDADAVVEEIGALAEAAGGLASFTALPLAAWRGDEAVTSELIAATMKELVVQGGGIGLAMIHWSNAVLYNGLGRYEEAIVAAERAVEHHDGFWARPELIEAAVRQGAMELAGDAFRRLSKATSVAGTDWALGIEARSRALMSDGIEAERLYREAIERLGRTRVRVELARAHLLYGEWLRRVHRRMDAREQLRIAHEMLTEMGIEAFADRARRELLATGETTRKRTVEASDELTPQEALIARLARDGLSNPEIGSQLFISPRTVEYHLRKVFVKLGISSRNELERVLPSEPAEEAVPLRA